MDVNSFFVCCTDSELETRQPHQPPGSLPIVLSGATSPQGDGQPHASYSSLGNSNPNCPSENFMCSQILAADLGLIALCIS